MLPNGAYLVQVHIPLGASLQIPDAVPAVFPLLEDDPDLGVARIDPCHAFNFVLHAGPLVFPPRSLARGLDAFGINGALRRSARNLIAVAWKKS